MNTVSAYRYRYRHCGVVCRQQAPLNPTLHAHKLQRKCRFTITLDRKLIPKDQFRQMTVTPSGHHKTETAAPGALITDEGHVGRVSEAATADVWIRLQKFSLACELVRVKKTITSINYPQICRYEITGGHLDNVSNYQRNRVDLYHSSIAFCLSGSWDNYP